MEYINKNRSNSFTKKPIKVTHGTPSSVQISSLNQLVAVHNQGTHQSSNSTGAKTEDQSQQNTTITKIEPKKFRINFSVTPDRTNTKKKSTSVSLSSEDMDKLLNSGIRKHQANPKRKLSDPTEQTTTRVGISSTDIRSNRQTIYRELNQNLSQKDGQVPKSHPKHLIEAQTTNQNKTSDDIKLPRIEQDKNNDHAVVPTDWASENQKKNLDDEKPNTKKGTPLKANSFGNPDSHMKNTFSIMHSPPLFKETKIKKAVPNPPHQVLAKRGTLVDASAIKSSAVNQPTSRKQSHSLNEIKSEIEEKPSCNKPAESENAIVSGFFYKSKAGALPDKPVKTNQDAFIVNPNFSDNQNYHLFAICDGHGGRGHDVSAFLKQNLPPRNAITQGFLQTRRELMGAAIEVDHSGSTAVSVLILNNRIFCANVGDSRAILAKLVNNDWIAVPLSKDHKPDDPAEMKRIVSCGGRVEPYKDFDGQYIGPARVWLKHDDIPGLAMARSFGDAVAGPVGVIAEPEIMDRYLEEEDKFVVLASDGIWDFISNEEVVSFIAPYYQKGFLDAACQNLIKEATTRWKQEDEVVDDITCIIVTLKVPSKTAQLMQ